MLPEDEKLMIRYGRLPTEKELEEMEDSETTEDINPE
jgi:hypothetical protein